MEIEFDLTDKKQKRSIIYKESYNQQVTAQKVTRGMPNKPILFFVSNTNF